MIKQTPTYIVHIIRTCICIINIIVNHNFCYNVCLYSSIDVAMRSSIGVAMRTIRFYCKNAVYFFSYLVFIFAS